MNRVLLPLLALLAAMVLLQIDGSGSRPALAVGSPPASPFQDLPKPLTASETRKIETYLRKTLGMKTLRLVPQPPEAEVFIGDRFLGVVYPEEQNGQRAFFFEMAIFDKDLESDEPPSSKR
jgi:hypothetical protein